MGSIVEYLTDEDVYDSNGNKTGEREITEYHQVDNVPCEPGLQTVKREDGEVVYAKVLFWHVHTSWRPLRKPNVHATPVTHDGAEDGAYVLHPDGKVRYFDEVYENVDEWIAAEKEWEEMQKEHEQKRVADIAAAEAAEQQKPPVI